jgi:hypothetical protein
MMYCMFCELGLQHIMPIPFALDPEATVRCPKCGSRGEIVSRDETDDEHDESSNGSDDDDSDSGYYSTGSSSSGSSGASGAFGCLVVVVIIGLVVSNSFHGPSRPLTVAQPPQAAVVPDTSNAPAVSPTEQILDAIHRAQPDWDLVNVAIANGGDINAADTVNGEGTTPLMAAAMNNRMSEVQYLLGHGAAIDKPDNFGRTPLFHAAARGFLDIAKYLIENGANVNAVVTLPTDGDANAPPQTLLDYVIQHDECREEDASCHAQWGDFEQYLIQHGARGPNTPQDAAPPTDQPDSGTGSDGQAAQAPVEAAPPPSAIATFECVKSGDENTHATFVVNYADYTVRSPNFGAIGQSLNARITDATIAWHAREVRNWGFGSFNDQDMSIDRASGVLTDNYGDGVSTFNCTSG